MQTYTAFEAKNNLLQNIRQVNETAHPVFITATDEATPAVIISKAEWDSITETLALANNGTLQKVFERQQDNSGVINADDLNWDDL